MKAIRKLFFPVLTGVALLLSCTEKQTGSPSSGEINLLLALEDIGATRTEINGTTGKVSWTDGDVVGVYITATERDDAYRPIPVETAENKITLTLDPGEARDGYAIYPYSASQVGNAEPLGTTPRVFYPDEYDMTGHDNGTYIPVPMIALNGPDRDVLKFYHTGGIVRVDLNELPAATTVLSVEFVGMEHVFGICSVSNPGTPEASTSLVSGYGNVVTFTGVSSATTHLNIPVPTLDFSPLTMLRIRAYSDPSAAPVRVVSKAIPISWGTLKHGFGRLIPGDFGNNGHLGIVRLSVASDLTLWMSEEATRSAQALYEDGKIYLDASISWSSSAPAVASVDATDGHVRCLAPGTAVITATATTPFGETQSASYNVYVNAVTGITLEPEEPLTEWGKPVALVATVAHTSNGRIFSYPSDMISAWTSDNASAVTLSDAVYKPVVKNASSGLATATANTASTPGTATVSVAVNDTYCASAPVSAQYAF